MRPKRIRAWLIEWRWRLFGFPEGRAVAYHRLRVAGDPKACIAAIRTARHDLYEMQLQHEAFEEDRT